MKDASKNSIGVSVIPEVTISQITLDTITGKASIFYTATQAAAYDFKVTAYVVQRLNDDKLLYTGRYHRETNLKMVVGETLEYPHQFGGGSADVKCVYFLATGTLKDGAGKIYTFENLYSYNTKSGQTQTLTPREYIWVRDFFNKNIKN